MNKPRCQDGTHFLLERAVFRQRRQAWLTKVLAGKVCIRPSIGHRDLVKFVFLDQVSVRSITQVL